MAEPKGRAIRLVHRHLGKHGNDVRQTSVWTLRFEKTTVTVQIETEVDSYPQQCYLTVKVLDATIGTWRRETLVWMTHDQLQVFKVTALGPDRDAAYQAIRGQGYDNPTRELKRRALEEDEGEALSRAVEILETAYGTLS